MLSRLARSIQWLIKWLVDHAPVALFAIAIIGGIALSRESEDRKNDRVTRAWTILAAGAELADIPCKRKPVTRRAECGNVGQIEALESLLADEARLDGANLSQFYLERIKLPEARLIYANIDGAHLQDADLRGAVLVNSNLAGANLTGAMLESADITNTDFRDVETLTQTQIDSACYDGKRKPWLPAELKPPKKICEQYK